MTSNLKGFERKIGLMVFLILSVFRFSVLKLDFSFCIHSIPSNWKAHGILRVGDPILLCLKV
jgi:hypothetical protein